VRWLCRLAERALGAAPPEDTLVGIIVTGAKNLWSPPGQGTAPWELWTHLRLLLHRLGADVATQPDRTAVRRGGHRGGYGGGAGAGDSARLATGVGSWGGLL
jgi:hypothetical protein